MRISLPLALPALALLAAACQDTAIATYNSPPETSITSPTDGASFQPGSLVELYGLARDAQQSPETLLISWSSSLDGELGTDAADSEGIAYLPVTALSAGVHAITLTAYDDAGSSGSASIQLEMGYGGQVVGAPTVIIINPTEGTTYVEADEVRVVGTATDDEQSWDTLTASVMSTIDGLLWTGNPASNGAVDALLGNLSEGNHTLTLTVEDQDGNLAEASVGVVVNADGRPSVQIIYPTDGSKATTTVPAVLKGMLSDDVSDNESLTYTWHSSLQGDLASGVPDSSGVASASVYLSGGTHIITLHGWDEDLNEGSDSITVVCIDPRDSDDDFDGQTENGGDCDDTNSAVYTGATEICDLLDNDCDGSINENGADTKEPNDSMSAWVDLGVIDDDFLGTDTLTVSGLTLHTSSDADWFYFDADDEIWDNASIDAQIRASSSATTMVVELYDCNSGCTLADSGSGKGSATVEHSGDTFDDDEDEWAIRVYASSWDAATCASTYSLTISTPWSL